MNPIEIIERYYSKTSQVYEILMIHSWQVQKRALEVVDKHPELGADRQFIEEAALLHDIGIYLTDAPGIGCFGTHKYIEHGYLGADILRQEGYPLHALVCERHTGVGISKERIITQNMPLPLRDLLPVSIEEQIICYADKFYSKSKLKNEASVDKIVKKLSKFSEANATKFMDWHRQFG